MGFSLTEIKNIYTDITYKSYLSLIEREVKKKEQYLLRQQMILELLNKHAMAIYSFQERLNTCELDINQSFYCLDFRHNDKLLMENEEDCLLLNSWMEKSLFTRCYSPFPMKLLYGETSDTTIGFAVKEEYAKAINLSLKAPVYHRKVPLCLRALIHHTFDLQLLPDGTDFIHKYMHENNLRFTEQEPFLISEISFHQDDNKNFFANLYIPVKKDS